MTTILKNKVWVIALLLTFWLVCDASASIAVRALVANPSETTKRKVPFKSYLPKEIKPENVIDAGGLEIGFDPKEGVYYVYKDYELEPKETVAIEIELEDVWKIPDAEISSLRSETGNLAKVLESTDYYERAMYLKNSIESKLAQIEQSQTVSNSSPGGYISDYRKNLDLLAAVKADLAAAKALVVEARSIAPMLTWKLILAILAFLGLLGVVFFIIWQRQIKSSAELAQDYGGSSETPSPFQQPEEGERRQSQSEKRSELEDIEKRLKEKKEE